MSPAKYIWPEIWPYESCLAVKLKFWPNTGFQYNIFSLAVLKKFLVSLGYDVEKNNSHLKLVLRSLVTKGTLLQIKDTGASGSFKLNKKRANPKDKATRKQHSGGARKSRMKGSANAVLRRCAAAGETLSTEKASFEDRARHKEGSPKMPSWKNRCKKAKAVRPERTFQIQWASPARP
uniref:H15 domain-containing protein n=1 Tax=Laticauda laticaudata TaxID=8630 RepID=A0A8C5RV09_LATLA